MNNCLSRFIQGKFCVESVEGGFYLTNSDDYVNLRR